jgi:RNA polymerase sigma-70 factor (ECF subfamily)
VDEASREQLEARLAKLCAERDYNAAASLAIQSYGPEIFGFLRATVGSDDPSEAFSDFAEGLWKGLPTFAWNSKLRTWAYGIARNVARGRRRERARRERRAAADASMVEDIAQKVRTDTLSILRTEKRTRLQALRDALRPEDRMLLVLRVDRGLPWNDLARVFSDRSDDAGIAREAARLRKRYQIVRERLREMARAEGLIE